MSGLRKEAVLAGTILFLATVTAAWAQTPHGPVRWLPDHDWSGQLLCRYPGPSKKASTATHQSIGQVTVINEKETTWGDNDTFADAETLTIAPQPMAAVNIDVKGTIYVGADVDRYRFTATKGDIIGLAVVGGGALDAIAAIEQTNMAALVESDNNNGLASMYPPSSPFPGGVSLYDPALTWVAPADGDYLIRVSSYVAASRGSYTLQIRARRPSFENENTGATQIIYLDFDGATFNAQETFSDPYARNPATLSPLRDFLPRWGLTAQDEAEVVTAIVKAVEETFDNLRLASLNGNRDVDNTNGHFDVQILNSRDHADPWGQPNVSRVIVGGTFDQLGILTIGIAQSIDPGNFAREETAVVLLDLLSEPKGSPWDANSVNAIGLAAGLTIYDSIGATVAHVVVHEAGHYLGNWHTDNENDVPSIMDTGGREIWYMAGAGADAILGTGDDQVIEFLTDTFDPYEAVAVGEERTEFNSAFGMATGKVFRETVPGQPDPTLPLTSVRATPTSGSPPLTVEFSAGAIDTDLSGLVFTWDFADGSAIASGPVVSHEFTIPGDFLVKVTCTNSQGAKGQATVMINVSATLPTAKIVATPTRGAAPLTVSFDGQSSTATTGTIIKYEWNFGDGTTSNTPSVQHVYATQGYYAVTLTVTDSVGGSSTATTLITVNASSGSTSLDAAQETPTINPTQCGLGGGVTMVGSFAGLFMMMLVRRRD